MERIDALNGALTGDAATMGLHWLYNQTRLAEINSAHEILFREPTPGDFEGPDGGLGYFAHAARKAGQYSQYGECAELVARLVRDGNDYTAAAHQSVFLERFGPGGDFVGYADRPTKALVARLLTEGDDLPAASGSDDDQHPALASVPALFAFNADRDTVAEAVQVTNTNDVAVAGALALFDCLTLLANGANTQSALNESANNSGPVLAPLILEALNWQDYEPLKVAEHFGMPCHLPQGLPIAWHIAKHAPDFEQAIRDNILCGGDSCGRVLAVGSIAGLLHGVPEHLSRQVTP